MKTRTKVGWIAAVVAAIGLYASTYVVRQDQQAVVTSFGKPVAVVVNQIKDTTAVREELEGKYGTEEISFHEGAGLYFKAPWESVELSSRKIKMWSGNADQINTLDKRFVYVDGAAPHFVRDPLTHYLKFKGDSTAASQALDTVIDSAIRTGVTNNNLYNLVRTTNVALKQDNLFQTPDGMPNAGNTPVGNPAAVEEGDFKGRVKIEEDMYKTARGTCSSEFGEGLLDVVLTSVGYTGTVKTAVEQNMISERQRVAKQIRAEGEKYAKQMDGAIEQKTQELTGEAARITGEITGVAQAEAKRIRATGFETKDDKGNPIKVLGYQQMRDYFDFVRGLSVAEKLNGRYVIGRDDPLLGYLPTPK